MDNLGSDTCVGQTGQGMKISRGTYVSNLYKPDDKQGKHDAIKEFLKKTNLTPPTGVCTGDCVDKEEKCRAYALRISGTNTDMDIAEVELFDVSYNFYVLMVKADTTITVTTQCECDT
jgi:hypothetical protein